MTFIKDDKSQLRNLDVSSRQSIQKHLMDHDEDLMLTELQPPLVKIPSVQSMSSTICPRHMTRRLPDHIRLLLQECDIVAEKNNFLIKIDQVPHVFDQHHSDERFPTSCSQVDYNVPSLGLLQQLNLERRIQINRFSVDLPIPGKNEELCSYHPWAAEIQLKILHLSA